MKQIIHAQDYEKLVRLLLERTFHPDPDEWDRIIGGKTIDALKAKVGPNGMQLAALAVKITVNWFSVNKPCEAQLDCIKDRVNF